MTEFGPAFSGRIQAMARIHTALAARRWEGLPLSELVDLVVGPYRRRADSVAVDCDGTFVSSDVVRVLGMALHELATNAAKYGALSAENGRLAISARFEPGDAQRLCIRWTEQGGPAVESSAPRGFGVRLIEEAIAYEFEGRVKLEFPRDGVRCSIEIPLRSARP
jgi:two-component system CheB/CheR fusion protein